jgi:pyroglutamyl-peptidase
LKRLGASELHVEVLPTAYARAGTRIEALLTSLKPSALVMLGLAGESSRLRFERLAHNMDQAELRDNDAEQRLLVPIVPAAPDSYESTLPLERFAARVQALGCPHEFSDWAGSFVCNHVFFRARHHVELNKLETRCGFLHVPPAPPAELEPWLGAVEACLDVLRREAELG